MQCLCNQRFIRLGTVAVRSVDEVHAEIEGTMQHAAFVAAVPAPSPNVGTAQTHRAEPHAIHGEIAEPDRARFCCIGVAKQCHALSCWKGPRELFTTARASSNALRKVNLHRLKRLRVSSVGESKRP